MDKRFHPCRAWLPVVTALFGILSGCRSLPPAASDVSVGLTPDEQAFASALAHYGQALLYEAERGYQTPQAYEEFVKASEADPTQHRLSARVAVGALMLRKPNEAIAALERSCALNPDSFKATVDLGKVYRAAGRPRDAIRQFERSARLAPDNLGVPIEIASLYFQLEHDEDALAVLRRALRRHPKHEPIVSFCYRVGGEFTKAKQFERAIGCFRLLAEEEPEQRPFFYQLLGELYEDLDRIPDAIASYRAATQSEPPLAQAFVRPAMLLGDSDPEESFAILREGARRLPNSSTIIFAAAYLRAYHGHHEEAIREFDRIWEFPGIATQKLTEAFYLQFGMSCEQTGQIEKAETVLRACIQHYPESHQALNYLAYVWADRDTNLDEALGLVKRALVIEPDSAAYIDTLGWIYYRMGRHADALTQLQRAMDLMPDDSTITEHVGDALMALGRKEEAVVYWKLSQTLNPDSKTVRDKLESRGTPDPVDPVDPVREGPPPQVVE